MFLTVFLFSCGEEVQEKKEVIRPVRYGQVFLAGSEQIRTFTGVSKSGTEANLSFRVGGIVEAVNVKVGQRIRKGKLMASVDNADARLNYEKSLATLKNANTQKDNAKSNLSRVKGLYENNNISLSEYETAKDTYASTNSAYNTEKRNVDLKKRELGYYKLYAPMDGIVATAPISRNEQVNPGQTVISIASSQDDIEVTVGMPEAFISRVKVGTKVTVRFLSFADKIFDGTISEVSFASGAQSSTYPVVLKVENATSGIRPGMPADVTFNFAASNRSQAPKLMVPTNAVAEDMEGNFVFTVTETQDGQAVVHKKRVSVGELSNDGFEVIDGLQNGDLVATAGVESLTDGIAVTLLK